jgi:hypothetical protein
MPPSIADLDGKRVIMGAPPGFECMMGCQTCWTEGHWQMSVLAPNKIVHHDPTMCFCCKASPCPCTTCPFYTPLGMRFEYTQDENDPTKWVGSGAICGGKESGCCAKQMHHDGDYFIVRPACSKPCYTPGFSDRVPTFECYSSMRSTTCRPRRKGSCSSAQRTVRVGTLLDRARSRRSLH